MKVYYYKFIFNENKNFIFLFKDKQELFPPPPPPPDSIQNLPKTERDALTSMLMSYYMSGFHTGLFYHYTKKLKVVFLIFIFAFMLKLFRK